MAETAHKTDLEKKEYFDTPEELEKKAEDLAHLIKNSKYFVAFTGAGISTSAGVKDFRSGIDTVLPTGPGVWEKQAQKIKADKPYVSKPMISAVPTLTHMALVKLMEEGILKFVISQNIDGVHRRSGIPASKIAEVHGNSNLEICKNKNCKKQFLRDFNVRKRTNKALEHVTERKCEMCGQNLYDSIINFGEPLPEKELEDGYAHCKKADLCLILGSSLKVYPAAGMPQETISNGGTVAIVNLQATHYDDRSLKINGMIDQVMELVMKKLDIPIPSFTLKRRFVVMKKKQLVPGMVKKTTNAFYLRGVDEQGNPFTLFKNIVASFAQGKEVYSKPKEPLNVVPLKTDMSQGKFALELEFYGHYNEPNFKFEIDLALLEADIPKFFMIEFDPRSRKWSKQVEFELEK